MVAAIVVAAGSSRRMGFDKLAAILAGRSVLEHSVRALASSGLFGQIILVTSEERERSISGWATGIEKEFGLRLLCVRGGAERHDSVAAGLAAVDAGATHVAVHDGARPMVSAEDVRRVVDEARRTGAASLAHPVVETLKRSDPAGWVSGSVDRSGLWAMETPQAFDASWLRQAYESALAAGMTLTDEVSAVQAAGRRVRLVASSRPNLKITHPQDLALAEHCMPASMAAEHQPPATVAT